ncbi:Bifunctional PLP-dependent enzyme with beta-cystathionase and maltose regulon repressor activities [hydrothermal vent metagenome]|uniref:cysteine-S-conjugate beta-lyase n=1 Tax=hydrothermal vent metagenome TaxID=652676 RepID=A0A3B0SCC3_9ZZZZ
MDFDEIINRRGTHSEKWDLLEKYYGLTGDDALAMWVADSDFRTAPVVADVVRRKAEHGVYGYFSEASDYRAATRWWLKNRHGWTIEPEWIIPLHGLGNALAMTIDVYTQPGDGVIVFSPVYHAFASKIRNAGRQVVECPLVNEGGRYTLDFDAYDALMTGNEKLILWCSPHNPGGRVWSVDELRGLAEFAERHDLVIVSDEVHQDLVYPGHTHVPQAVATPDICSRLVTLMAASKTFNIAGMRVGNVIIEDNALRTAMKRRVLALGLQPNAMGLEMTTAAYSAEGAVWVDEQVTYLDGNRQLFDAAINNIPGLASMPLEATYLAWVDFESTGMDRAEFTRRVQEDARIAVNHGPAFGSGGDNFLRFNLATPRAHVEEAVSRLKDAFSDLQ